MRLRSSCSTYCGAAQFQQVGADVCGCGAHGQHTVGGYRYRQLEGRVRLRSSCSTYCASVQFQQVGADVCGCELTVSILWVATGTGSWSGRVRLRSLCSTYCGSVAELTFGLLWAPRYSFGHLEQGGRRPAFHQLPGRGAGARTRSRSSWPGDGWSCGFRGVRRQSWGGRCTARRPPPGWDVSANIDRRCC